MVHFFLYSRCWQFIYRFEGIFSLFLIIVDMINLDGNFRRYLDYFCLKDMIMHMQKLRLLNIMKDPRAFKHAQ